MIKIIMQLYPILSQFHPKFHVKKTYEEKESIKIYLTVNLPALIAGKRCLLEATESCLIPSRRVDESIVISVQTSEKFFNFLSVLQNYAGFRLFTHAPLSTQQFTHSSFGVHRIKVHPRSQFIEPLNDLAVIQPY